MGGGHHDLIVSIFSSFRSRTGIPLAPARGAQSRSPIQLPHTAASSLARNVVDESSPERVGPSRRFPSANASGPHRPAGAAAPSSSSAVPHGDPPAVPHGGGVAAHGWSSMKLHLLCRHFFLSPSPTSLSSTSPVGDVPLPGLRTFVPELTEAAGGGGCICL
jgi:hypothetical protein